MNKRVLFTENQLKQILGEDIYSGAYNDENSHGTELNTSSIEANSGEVHAEEPSDVSKPMTTDRYGKSKTPKSYAFRGAHTAMYENNDKKKVLSERNKELDGKKIFSLPDNLRKLAVQNGSNNEIMQKLASGEKMDLSGLYRIRKEIENNPNNDVKSGVDSLIKQAQRRGASLRNVQKSVDDMYSMNSREGKEGAHTKKCGQPIYYENN